MEALMSEEAPQVIGPRQVDVASVDGELVKIWKTLAPAVPDESPPLMQASVVNLVAIAGGTAAADDAAGVMARLMSRAPGRFIVLDSQPESDPPGIEAFVSVMCEKAGERQICCELIRVGAKGIAADSLPTAVEAFYAPDLTIVTWWLAPLDRADLPEFAASADRIVLDSLAYGRDELRRAAAMVEQSRRTRTAVADLNWERLTPYRQLFAQFFDSAECRSHLEHIQSVTLEARESAGALMAGWLVSRLNQPPYALRRDQIEVRIADGDGPVLRAIVMNCGDAEFSVIRRDSARVEAHATMPGETTQRIVRIPLAPVEKLLGDEIWRSGRDRAYDGALRAAMGE
jgi:glucose-6-phosphate dehydrogenase assembly protein OpcA